MPRRMPALFALAVAAFCLLYGSVAATAQIRLNSGFRTNILPGNDDGSTGPVSIGFTIDLFGTVRDSLYVNNNGNVTFDYPIWWYTPFGLTDGGVPPILAPFFADVDTRVGEQVTYGYDLVDGRPAFGVNWFEGPNDLGVGYFPASTDKLNKFQLVLIDRSDTGIGNFDFEFNYGRIQWETGGASGGSGGLGGYSDHAGWSNGLSGALNVSYEIPGSGVNGAHLDSNLVTGLIYTSNVGIPGRWMWTVRQSEVLPPPPPGPEIPEPGAMALLLAAIPAGLLFVRRRR